jgi:hypothetical protein
MRIPITASEPAVAIDAIVVTVVVVTVEIISNLRYWGLWSYDDQAKYNTFAEQCQASEKLLVVPGMYAEGAP